MKLQKPYKGDFKLGQRFGQNFNGYYQSEGLKGHGGLDIPMPIGTPLYAACDGMVIYISTDIQRGEGVTIMSDDTFEYNGKPCKLSVVCWHMKDKSILVKVGDKVKKGDPIGLSGNTGQTTGPHLHFGTAPLSADGSRRLLADGNGYKGMIDPLPYLDVPEGRRTLKKGMRGVDVKELQTKLNTRGYSLSIDGIFGKNTRAAILDFQTKNNLYIDGVVGMKTYEKLYD